MIPRGSITTPVAVIGFSMPFVCVVQMMFTTAVRAVVLMTVKFGTGCADVEAVCGACRV